MKHARRPLSPKKAEVLPSQLHRPLAPARTMLPRDARSVGASTALPPPADISRESHRSNSDAEHHSATGQRQHLARSNAEANEVTVVVSEATADDGRSQDWWRDAPRQWGDAPHHPLNAATRQHTLTAYQMALKACSSSLLPHGRRLPQEQHALDNMQKLEHRRALMSRYTRPLGTTSPSIDVPVPSRSSSVGAKRSSSADGTHGQRNRRINVATVAPGNHRQQRRTHSVQPLVAGGPRSDRVRPMSATSSLNVSKATAATTATELEERPCHLSSASNGDARTAALPSATRGAALPATTIDVPVIATSEHTAWSMCTHPMGIPPAPTCRDACTSPVAERHHPPTLGEIPSARSSVSPASSSALSVIVEEQTAAPTRIPLTPLSRLNSFATPRPLRRNVLSYTENGVGVAAGCASRSDDAHTPVHPAIVVVRQLTQPRPCFSTDSLLVDISKKAELHALTRVHGKQQHSDGMDGVKGVLGDAIYMVPTAMLEQCERQALIQHCFTRWRDCFHNRSAERVRIATMRAVCLRRWQHAFSLRQQSMVAVGLQQRRTLQRLMRHRLVSTALANRFHRFCVLRSVFQCWASSGASDGGKHCGTRRRGPKGARCATNASTALPQDALRHSLQSSNDDTAHMSSCSAPAEYEVFDGYPLIVASARYNAATKSLALRYWRSWLISTRYASYRRELDQLAIRSCRSRTLLAVWHRWTNASSRARVRNIEARVFNVASRSTTQCHNAAPTCCVPPSFAPSGLGPHPCETFSQQVPEALDTDAGATRSALLTAATAPLPPSLAVQRTEWQRVLIGSEANATDA